MKYLVTGAAGFIGAHLFESLAKDGHTVIGVDSFNDYYSPSLKRDRVAQLISNKNATISDINLEEENSVNALIQEFMPDTVFHFAAQPCVRLQFKEYSSYIDRNIVGFSNLVRSCVTNEVPDIVYASSSSVYGNFPGNLLSESSHNLDPISFYGATKLAGEILANSAVRNSATRARGLRLFTVYGPWGRPDMAYFRLISNIIADYPFEMYGDGTIKRDFTNISDVIRITKLLGTELATHKKGFHDVVNIGGGNPVSLLSMVEKIEEILHKKIVLKKYEHNQNDVNFTNADTTYLKSLVGTTPNVQLSVGLSEVVNWATTLPNVMNLKNWCESVR